PLLEKLLGDSQADEPRGEPSFRIQRTQVRFATPAGMQVDWITRGGQHCGEGGRAPFRYNFSQGAVYRLKLSDIAGHPGLELYPTLEIAPTNSFTEEFVAHTAVPVSFTEEDFDEVQA